MVPTQAFPQLASRTLNHRRLVRLNFTLLLHRRRAIRLRYETYTHRLLKSSSAAVSRKKVRIIAALQFN